MTRATSYLGVEIGDRLVTGHPSATDTTAVEYVNLSWPAVRARRWTIDGVVREWMVVAVTVVLEPRTQDGRWIVRLLDFAAVADYRALRARPQQHLVGPDIGRWLTIEPFRGTSIEL